MYLISFVPTNTKRLSIPDKHGILALQYGLSKHFGCDEQATYRFIQNLTEDFTFSSEKAATNYW